MEFLMELLLELILEGSIEVSSNQNVSKWIRYPLIFFLLLFFVGVIGLLFFMGILFWDENMWVSLFVVSVGIFLLFASIFQFRTLYFRKVSAKEKD